jgi:predicted NACHT family NTPase
MHHRQVMHDSGITVPELTEVLYVALDTFQEVVQNEIKTDLHGWLTLLSARNVETITKLIEKFPEFLGIYQEMAAFVEFLKARLAKYESQGDGSVDE